MVAGSAGLIVQIVCCAPSQRGHGRGRQLWSLNRSRLGGSIYNYGALPSRVIAGAMGSLWARIFCCNVGQSK